VVKRTLKLGILEGLSCVAIGELFNLIKFEYSPLKNRNNKSTYLLLGTLNKVSVSYLVQCKTKTYCTLLLNLEMQNASTRLRKSE
jgi:hypothetical protein